MTNNDPGQRQLQAVTYLTRARQLMHEDGMSPEESYRLVVTYAMSLIAAENGGEDALPAWLRAEADAIELHSTKPGGTA